MTLSSNARAQRTSRPQRQPLALVVAGGVLLALSGEPWGWKAAGFLGLGLWLEASARLAPGTGRVLPGTWLGFAFGFTVNGIALYSIAPLLEAFGHFPPWLAWPTAGLAFAAQALPYAAAGALTEFCVARGFGRWLAFPVCLVLGMGLVPQLFPWRPCAPQVGFLLFAQLADLGGEALLDGAMALIAAGTWQSLRGLSGQALGMRVRPALVGLSVLLLACGYGAVRLPQIERARAAAEPLKLGLVQSNVGISMKHDPERAAGILRDLRRLTVPLEAQGADLTVWAETAYPYPLLRTRGAQPSDDRSILGHGVRGPILFGGVTYQEQGELVLKYNTAWVVRSDGRLGDRVDKSRLLAFGEYVPFWHYLPPLQERFPSPGFQTGENDVVRVGRGIYGILICYEDLFAGLARKVVDRGANVLVNMTNDAWFGDSNEPALHDMVAHLRAIETRRDLVRVVNTGVTSFTRASGEVVVRSDTFTQTSFLVDVRPLTLRTVYVSLGDWLTPLLAIGLLARLLALRLRRSP